MSLFGDTIYTSSPDYWIGLEEQRQEDESGGGFAWRREEEEGDGGGGENGEDYDDCYCEDCVVGATHLKIYQTTKALRIRSFKDKTGPRVVRLPKRYFNGLLAG